VPRTEYTGLVLVATLIGILGAVGNIVFRYAITFAGIAFNWLGTLVVPWPRLAPPVVLAASAIVLLGLERLFPGHALGYGFPRFLEMIHLEGGRVKKRWMVEDARHGGVTRRRRVGRSRGPDRADRWLDRICGGAAAADVDGADQALRRLWRGRRGRDHVQRADCRRDVTPETNLGQALGRMEADDLEEIPVVDAAEPWRVVGLLSRGDAIRAYNRALLAMRTVPGTAGADEKPQWSKAYRVTTVPVPPHWQGQSLRELDWRARYGVSVLALHPHDQPGQTLEVPDPDRTLVTGDSLVIAGQPANVRRFERAARATARTGFSPPQAPPG